jgi:hypothetical protein
MADEGARPVAGYRNRHHRLSILVDDATAVLQSVVNEVVPGVVDALDVGAIVQRIDIQAIVNQLDVQAVLDQIDIQALLEQVDLDAVLERVDLERLIDRIDVNALVQRVDVNALVQRTELGTVVSRATGGVAGEALDAMRSAGVGLDGFVQRWVDRVLRRSGSPGGTSAARVVEEAVAS